MTAHFSQYAKNSDIASACRHSYIILVEDSVSTEKISVLYLKPKTCVQSKTSLKFSFIQCVARKTHVMVSYCSLSLDPHEVLA